ncbi:MAG: PD-(D/E)XK nuclease family protein, partial [Chloroflexota bacterium]|nr:PD-(D/E)XK nuclease family protein [Chloroflexota bacterium]
PDALTQLETKGGLRSEVVELYRRFRERTRDYYDREDLAEAAAGAVTGGVASGLHDLGPIVFFLVPDLTAGERALVEALAGRWQCAVLLGLTGDHGADAPVQGLAARLSRSLGPPAYSMPAHPPCASRLVAAPDPRQEVRWVLRHLMKAAEDGMPFRQMAILYRQIDPYAALLREQLALAGIPAAGPGNVAVSESASGRTLLGLVHLAQDPDLPRHAVMAWLTGCPISPPGGAGSALYPSRWDALSRQAGVVKGTGQWQDRLERHAAELERQAEDWEVREEISEARAARMREDAKSARALAAFVAGLAARLLPPSDGSRWQEFAGWAKDLLDAYLDRKAAPPEGREPEDASLERLESTLREMSALDTVEPRPSLARFALALNEAVSTPMGHLGETGRGVFVGPLGAALGLEFDLVHVVGMVEGLVPARSPDDPLIPDRERLAAGGPNAGIPLRGAREAEERYRYLAALASGTTRLLSYPCADPGAQRGQSPSRWLLQAASRLHGKPVYSSTLLSLAREPWLEVVASAEDGLRTVAQEAPADEHDFDLARLWRWRRAGRALTEHHLAESGPLAQTLALERGRASAQLTCWDGDVSALAGKARRLRIHDRPVLSPTALETWAACPFSYLLGRALGVTAIDRPEEVPTISAMDRGSLVHSILERFLRRVGSKGTMPAPGEPWTHAHRELMHGIAHDVFQGAEARGITGKALLWEVEQDALLRDLDAFLEADARLRARLGATPWKVEVRFGFPSDKESLPAAEWDLPGMGILRFRGIVDRVDVIPADAGALVLDYKTGRISSYGGLKGDPVDRGCRLQLPICALALKAHLKPEATVRAAYWFVSTRGKFALLPAEPISVQDVAEAFGAALGTIASGVAHGLFPANPGPESRTSFENCAYCDFDPICSPRRDVVWERKQRDPRLAAYVRLAGGEPATDKELA